MPKPEGSNLKSVWVTNHFEINKYRVFFFFILSCLFLAFFLFYRDFIKNARSPRYIFCFFFLSSFPFLFHLPSAFYNIFNKTLSQNITCVIFSPDELC